MSGRGMVVQVAHGVLGTGVRHAESIGTTGFGARQVHLSIDA